MATASTMAESAIVRIEKEAMIRVLREQPAFSQLFMAFLLSRNVQIEADLVDQLFNSSEKRLARTLLLLANFGKDGKLEPVIPQINQEILAARVGTTRSRINYFMNKFRTTSSGRASRRTFPIAAAASHARRYPVCNIEQPVAFRPATVQSYQ